MPRYERTPASPSIQQIDEVVATMPSRPLDATAVDIMRFSQGKLSTSGYSAAEKRLSRQGARISAGLCDFGVMRAGGGGVEFQAWDGFRTLQNG